MDDTLTPVSSSRPSERDRTRALYDSRAARGRYLERHHARIIEQGNLFVIEFVDQPPWYTRAAASARQQQTHRMATPPAVWSLAFFSVGASALTLAYLCHLL